MKVELYYYTRLEGRYLNIFSNFFHVTINDESDEVNISTFTWNKNHDNIDIQDVRYEYKFHHILESREEMNVEDVINMINSYINLVAKYQQVSISFNKLVLVNDNHMKIYLK